MSKNRKQTNSEINNSLSGIAQQLNIIAEDFFKKDDKKPSLGSTDKIEAALEININFLKEEARKLIEKDNNSSFFNQVSGIADNILKDESYLKIREELNLYEKIQKIKKLPKGKENEVEEVFNQKLNEETGKNISNIIKSELDKDFYQALPQIKSILELCGDDLKRDIRKLVYDKIKEKKEEKKEEKTLKLVFAKEEKSRLFDIEIEKMTYGHENIKALLKNPQNYEAEIYHDFTIKKAKTIDELKEKFPSCGLKSEMIPGIVEKIIYLYNKESDKSNAVVAKYKGILENILPLLPFERRVDSFEYEQKGTQGDRKGDRTLLGILNHEEDLFSYRGHKLAFRATEIGASKTLKATGEIASATLKATGNGILLGLGAVLYVSMPVAKAGVVVVEKVVDGAKEFVGATLSAGRFLGRSLSESVGFVLRSVDNSIISSANMTSRTTENVKNSVSDASKYTAKEISNFASTSKEFVGEVGKKAGKVVVIGAITTVGVASGFYGVASNAIASIPNAAVSLFNKTGGTLSRETAGIRNFIGNGFQVGYNIVNFIYEGAKHAIVLIKRSRNQQANNRSSVEEFENKAKQVLVRLASPRGGGGRG